MKRVGLKEQFHGEPNPNQEGIAAVNNGNDQIILNIVGGAISFVAPSNVPDDEVTQEKYLERFINCTLQLENGAQLLIWINAGAHGVEVQVEPPRAETRRTRKRLQELMQAEWR